MLGIDGLDLKHVDGAIKLESVEPNIKEPNNPSILPSSLPTGSTGVAPTCSASIPAADSVEASNPATHPSRGVSLNCIAPIPAPHSDQPVSATTSKSAAKANKKAVRKHNSSLATNKVPPKKPLPNLQSSFLKFAQKLRIKFKEKSLRPLLQQLLHPTIRRISLNQFYR